MAKVTQAGILKVLAGLQVTGLFAVVLIGRFAPLPSSWDAGLLLVLALIACASAVLLLRKPSAVSRGAGTEEGKPGHGNVGDMHSQMGKTYPIIFHEIKNFASTLKGNTILLKRDLPAGGSRVSLERLERATEQIDHLAREVLDLSLLGRPGNAHPLDLQPLIRTCAESYFTGLGMAFSFTSDRATLPVNGDPRRLEQVFLNLFKNSLEAGATHISISIFSQPGKIGIMIDDNGRGCTSEEVGKMFEAYHSFKSNGRGSGLGLFLVKAIVEGHEDTIAGISKNATMEGVTGMIFFLHFPTTAGQSAPKPMH